MPEHWWSARLSFKVCSRLPWLRVNDEQISYSTEWRRRAPARPRRALLCDPDTRARVRLPAHQRNATHCSILPLNKKGCRYVVR